MTSQPTLPLKRRKENYSTFWIEVLFGIGLGEALFPAILISTLVGPELFYKLSSTTVSDSLSLIGVSFTSLMLLVFPVGISTFLASYVAGAPIAYVVTLWHRSLGLNYENTFSASLVGSAVGLTLACSFFPFPLQVELDRMGLLLITIATVLGQVGGYWRARKVLRYRKSNTTKANGPRRHIQFGLRHLLILTAWVAALLVTLRLFGLLHLNFLTILATWTATQLVVLGATSILTRIRKGNELPDRST